MSARPDAAPVSPGAALDPLTVAELTHLLRRGRDAEAAEQLEALAPGARPADPHRALLDAIVAGPHVRAALSTLEEWLDGTVDPEAALPLAASWALPAAELDLAGVSGDARLFIDAYPLEARVLGGLPERAATWLVARMAQTVTPAQRLVAVRRAIDSLAAAATPRFSSSSASLRLIADHVDDDQLWYQLALEIVRAELRSGTAPAL